MSNLQKAQQFYSLHKPGAPFIMANAWNAGSAILLEKAGIKAIGTTSAGIAYECGLSDSTGDLSFESALQQTEDIVAAVTLPVSMDAENGYGHSPEAVAENLTKIIATGVVGASIEDFTGDKTNPLYDIELAAERIQAAKQVADNLDYPFTITARAEYFLTGHDDAFNESVRRVNRYYEAGADCLFVPGLREIETIKTFVDAAAGPVSVVMGLSGKPITLAELKQVGVARISIGGSLARATLGLVRQAAKEMVEKGSFGFSEMQIPDAELCDLFAIKNGTK